MAIPRFSLQGSFPALCCYGSLFSGGTTMGAELPCKVDEKTDRGWLDIRTDTAVKSILLDGKKERKPWSKLENGEKILTPSRIISMPIHGLPI